MRIILFCLFLFSCAGVFAQPHNTASLTDTAKHFSDSTKKIIKADSALYYPDSTVFKIPARLLPAYLEVSHGNADGILVGQLKEIIAITEQQSTKQLVKKPKK